MKENFIHVCFVIDESGSMRSSQKSVIDGFKEVIEEQKKTDKGSCSVSVFKFASNVSEVFHGKDIKDVELLTEETYQPDGMTAMNDGIGYAIDTIGKWLDGMPEDEKPEKNLFVVMTDGMENNSKDYTLDKVKAMIKHQEEKYNWSFMYIGTDITDASAANSLGFTHQAFSAREDSMLNYMQVNAVTCAFRCTSGSTAEKYAVMENSLSYADDVITENYEKKLGRKIANSKKKA